jgi:hypothetical protein
MSGDVCLTCIKKNPSEKELLSKHKLYNVTLYDQAGKPHSYTAKKGQTLKQIEKKASKFYGFSLWYRTWGIKPRKLNPIAIYNPKLHGGANFKDIGHGLTVVQLPATQIDIRYRRTTGSHRGKSFRHIFKSSVSMFGLSNGWVILKSNSGKKLWGTVD